MQKKTLIINPQITHIVFGTLVRKAAKIGIKTAMLMRDEAPKAPAMFEIRGLKKFPKEPSQVSR
jgi:hypothetical protein